MPQDGNAVRKDISRFLQKAPNVYLAKLLPLSMYRRYLALLGLVYLGLNTQERENISRSLKFVLGEGTGWVAFHSVLWKTYFGIVEHYYEKMINAHRALPAMIQFLTQALSFSGQSVLDRADAEGKGCILVTGHFGAVEYIPLFLAANHYRPSMIVRFKTESLRRALVEKSRSVDLELIDADNPNVVFKALRAIQRKRILITMCDEIRHWRPSRRRNATLFGSRIPEDRTLDTLCRRSKAPVVFGIVQREKSGYDVKMVPIAGGGTDWSICSAVWKRLETIVYRNPEQWYQWPSFYREFTRYSINQECHDH